MPKRRHRKPRGRISDPRPEIPAINDGATGTAHQQQDSAATRQKAKKEVATTTDDITWANIPIISNWKLQSDNSVKGFISGSTKYSYGNFTTSKLLGEPSSYSVIRTASGSTYYLAKSASPSDSVPSKNPDPPCKSSRAILKSSNKPSSDRAILQSSNKPSSDRKHSSKSLQQFFQFDGQYGDIKTRLEAAKKKSTETKL